MGGDALGQRRGVASGEVGVGSLDRAAEEASAGVVGVLLMAARGGEDEGVESSEGGGGLVDGKRLVQRGEEVNLAHPGVRLGVRDPEAACRQIDIAPPEGERLADPQAAERQGCEEGAARSRQSVAASLSVEFSGGIQQRDDLLGSVEPGPLGRALLESPALPPSRVAGNQVAL
ncbi:MAG TPA: hypothetical protein VFX85_12950 [Solirubrobacterales bacterium]|nr:hypothetical protein [Solirubrobacterales bacterium]